MTFDSVVVGGGVSGLAAALILARKGRRVAVVEQAPRLAPLIRGFSREGVYFDSAFHYAGGLGEGEILDLFFRYLGLSEGLEKYPFRAEGFDRFRDTDSGWEFAFPTGNPQLQEALNAAFPGEQPAIAAYLDALQQACGSLPYLDPEVPAEQWDGSAVVQGPTLGEVLDRLTDNRALKNLLSLHTLLHGVLPGEVPFAIHASVAALYYRSAVGIAGGGAALAQAFEARLAAAGVTVVLGRAVKSLTTSAAGRLQGVELSDGERLECRECLVSTHPRHFLDMAPEGALKPAFRKRLGGLEETASAFILYAAGGGQSLRGSNLILGRLEATEAPWSGELAQRPLFLAANSAGGQTDPAGWVAICPASWQETAAWSEPGASRRGPGYRQHKERVAAELLERLRRQAPELAAQARVLATATPLTLRDFGGSPAGGLYGVKHKVGQYNPQPATRIPGVLLTGQAAAAPGVLGAITSAFLTCGNLFGHDQLRREVLECR
ncbi:phytoene desaturase [Desulfuromonas versatilis]|uniref:Phytoene desaturase n=1 Tax=Desulfuromonas versatilis TaxID=2802975 RepID=A0ABM8HNW2_9BACT|nr:FAD-dependent oxidoreductase [Desulfuromonas versatilis]BCR03180.1 phytoene desaturase [Desulfuromonas versatilis]